MGKKQKIDAPPGLRSIAGVMALIEGAAACKPVEVTVAMPTVGMELILQLRDMASAMVEQRGSKRDSCNLREVAFEDCVGIIVFAKIGKMQLTVTATVTDGEYNQWRAGGCNR
jgi:hypothetical protein